MRLLDLLKVVQFRTSGSLYESHSGCFVEQPVFSGQFMNTSLVTFIQSAFMCSVGGILVAVDIIVLVLFVALTDFLLFILFRRF